VEHHARLISQQILLCKAGPADGVKDTWGDWRVNQAQTGDLDREEARSGACDE
jgi:hypothetical protein